MGGPIIGLSMPSLAHKKPARGLLIKESQTCASWSNFPNREGGCPGCPMARSRATFDRIPYVETVSVYFYRGGSAPTNSARSGQAEGQVGRGGQRILISGQYGQRV